MILKEFGCGHSIRAGSQIISWIVLIICFFGLYEINAYYYETKKVKLTESPLTLLILNFSLGIIASICGLYGAYHNRRIWLKPFFIYILCQFALMAIVCWIYYIYIYPTQPPNPKKTRYVILNTILFGVVSSGFLSYAAVIVYSYYKQISSEISDREFLINTEDRQVLLNEDNFPSNMSSVSEGTTRSYLTTMQANERQRYSTNFNPPPPLAEEIQIPSQDIPKQMILGAP